MSRKRTRHTPDPVQPDGARPDSKPHKLDPSITLRTNAVALPNSVARRWISLLIVLHFAGLILAWGGNLSPSLLHGELLRWLAPFHVATGQDYIMLPLDLTHSTTIDSPTFVQYQLDGEAKWRTISPRAVDGLEKMEGELLPASFSMSRSRWSNLLRLLAWIAVEQPDSELVPEFLKQQLVMARVSGMIDPSKMVSEVRLFQPHALTFDQKRNLASNPQLANLVVSQLPGNSLYSAMVVQAANNELALITREEPRRMAAPVPNASTIENRVESQQ
jgi:hypothetical protein